MTDNLPELPEQDEVGFPSKDDTNERYYYSGEAMRSYALTAIASERARADALKTVMIAAAEEIAAHWEAHCDAEGYGPQNLLHRLEEGIPSEYGYTAGAFADLKSRADALEAALQAIVEYNNTMPDDGSWAELMADARSLLEKTNDR